MGISADPQRENKQLHADLAVLSQQAADLALLNTLNTTANRGDSLADIITLIAERTRDLFHGYGVSVLLADETKTHLLIQNMPIPTTLRHSIEHILGREIPPIAIALTPDSIFTRAINAQKAILVTGDGIVRMEREYAKTSAILPDTLINQAIKLTNRVMKIKAVLIAPLSHEEELVGTIDISSTNEFSATDMTRFDALAAQLTGIIARKQANIALQQSEALYQSLVEAIPQNIFRKDTAGRFTFVNQNFCRTERKSPAEILGKTDFDLHPRELAEKYRRDDAFVIKSGKTLELIEQHQQRDDTSATHVRLIKTPLFNADGAIIGVQGIFEDIALQMENEKRLKRYALRLKLLHEIDRAILAASSPIDIAQAALDPLLRIIDARRASVVMLDEAAKTGTILAAAGNVNPHTLKPGAVFPILAYPVYRHFQQTADKIIQSRLTPSASPIYQSLKQEVVNVTLSVILLLDDELVGALNFGFTHTENILPEYREIASEVGDSLAVTLRQALQTEKIRTESAAKTRLLQEVDHRVRNNLAAIAGMIYLEIRQAKLTHTPISERTLNALNVRVRSLAALHELLASHTWNPLPLRDVASRVFNAATRASDTADKELITHISACDILVPPETAQNLTLLFGEIIFHIIEYALPGHNRLALHFSAERTHDTVTMVFRIENVAFPQTMLASPPDSVGMALFTTTVKQSLHGEWHMANDGGSAVTTVRFPATLVSPSDAP